MPTKAKTWASVYSDLEDTFRKLGIKFTITAQYQGRQATKVCYTPEERAVTLTFHRWINGASRPVTLTMRKHNRTLDNLEAIAKAVEHLRMAQVREIEEALVILYRQLKPQTLQDAPPPKSSSIPEHYRILGVLPDAPMSVIEAAWKAQIREHHPDRGGSTAKAQQINAAIERIRVERAS